MRKLRYIGSLITLIFLAVLGWAVNRYIWFGSDLAPKNYALELRTLQANAGGLLPDDLRAYEQAVLIENKVAAIEASGLREPSFDSFDSLSVEDQERVVAWVGAFEDAGLFEDFHQLGQIPAYVYPWSGSKLFGSAYTDELSAIRKIIRVGRYQVMDAIESGDPGAAIAIIRDQVQVAAIFLTQPVAILRLTGNAILAHSISNTLHLTQADLSSKEIAELVSIYDAIQIAPLQSLFDGELLLGEEAIASTFQSNVTLRIMSRGALASKLNAVHSEFSTWAMKSVSKRRADPFTQPEFEWYEAPVDILIPAYEKLVQANDQISCQLAGIRVVLAIDSYRSIYGTLPSGLGELVPHQLAEAIPDHYTDSSTPFGYSLVDDLDLHPNGYILYTVGYDGLDNGGIPAADQPHAALTADAPGTDFVLNLPN